MFWKCLTKDVAGWRRVKLRPICCEEEDAGEEEEEGGAAARALQRRENSPLFFPPFLLFTRRKEWPYGRTEYILSPPVCLFSLSIPAEIPIFPKADLSFSLPSPSRNPFSPPWRSRRRSQAPSLHPPGSLFPCTTVATLSRQKTETKGLLPWSYTGYTLTHVRSFFPSLVILGPRPSPVIIQGPPSLDVSPHTAVAFSFLPFSSPRCAVHLPSLLRGPLSSPLNIGLFSLSHPLKEKRREREGATNDDGKRPSFFLFFLSFYLRCSGVGRRVT